MLWRDPWDNPSDKTRLCRARLDLGHPLIESIMNCLIRSIISTECGYNLFAYAPEYALICIGTLPAGFWYVYLIIHLRKWSTTMDSQFDDLNGSVSHLHGYNCAAMDKICMSWWEMIDGRWVRIPICCTPMCRWPVMLISVILEPTICVEFKLPFKREFL